MYIGELREIKREQDNYLRENNYKKMCGVNLWCCELNFYRNVLYYYQQFFCYIYKN
jgi:hypothetical protein